MIIGITPGGSLARRVARVLLADGRTERLGVTHPSADDKRTVPLTGLEPDVLVVFEDEHAAVAEARSAGTPIISNAGSGFDGGLATLAHSLSKRLPGTADLVAWTETGRRLGSGTTVPFPAPLGTHFGRPVDKGVSVPVAGPWEGILVSGEGHTVAAVDEAGYLTAISLAARAIVAIEHPAGDEWWAAYLDECVKAGAVFAAATR